MANVATEQQDGIYLVGSYEGSRPGKPFQRRDGSTANPVELGVRVGDDVVAVRYDGADEAMDALAGAAVGDRIELRVFARLVKDFDRRFAFITYEGPRAGGQTDGGWQ